MAIPDMTALQNHIGSWARKTFPDQTDDRVVRHLGEEVREIHAAIHDNGDEDKIRENVADCLILLLCLAERQGFSAYGAVIEKMAVNRQREWRYDPELGYDKHVPLTNTP